MVLERPDELERRLPLALAILRVTTGVFFLVWALEKLVKPDVTAAIWDKFYGIPLEVNLSYPLGILNTLMSLALIVGFKRRFTYAYWTLFHFISVASTWNYLIKPFGGPNHLFLAGDVVDNFSISRWMARVYPKFNLGDEMETTIESAKNQQKIIAQFYYETRRLKNEEVHQRDGCGDICDCRSVMHWLYDG